MDENKMPRFGRQMFGKFDILETFYVNNFIFRRQGIGNKRHPWVRWRDLRFPFFMGQAIKSQDEP